VDAESHEVLMERLDTFVWRHRNLLAGLPLSIMFLSTRWELENDVVIWPLAIGLCVLGVALRSWANCHCWYAQRRPMGLITSGPYACVRNPLYIGNLLILTGAAVASELLWLVPAASAWAALVYARAARAEERQLLARYGEPFIRYRRHVPGWLPRGQRLPLGKGDDRLLAVAMRQAVNLLILAPFVIKEIGLFGRWQRL
jgi:protein-S-isoprenylcysteine O-methyltransferase Ste14